MLTNEQLKPCSFCGGCAVVSSVIRHGHGGCDLYQWQIRCKDCGARVPCADDEAIRDNDGIRLTVDGRKNVINAWNNRPIEDTLSAEIAETNARADMVMMMYDEMKAERDAAVEDLRKFPGLTPCHVCKHGGNGVVKGVCSMYTRDCFVWRGIKKEATHD